MPKNIAYLRVSTLEQGIEKNKAEIFVSCERQIFGKGGFFRGKNFRKDSLEKTQNRRYY